MQVAYGGGEIELEELQWSEHQANPGDGMALQGRRELRQVGEPLSCCTDPSLTAGRPWEGA